MNILITESQFKRLIENIINEKYPPSTREDLDIKNDMEDDFVKIMKDVIEKTDPRDPDRIYYVDKNNKKIYMEHDQENEFLWVHHHKLWSFFESKYKLKEEEIQRFFKDMMSEHYNLWDVIPSHFEGMLWGIDDGKHLSFRGLPPYSS